MDDIELVIKIPRKEFGIDINDKFQDFFRRLKVEIKEHLITDTSLVCGAYELETIEMFMNAFNKSILLPKGHGRILDEKDILDTENNDGGCYDLVDMPEYIAGVKAIIEAESEETIMDICEYAEKVFGMKLLDCQKELLKKIDESYKENKPLRFIPDGRGSSHGRIMLALQMRAIAEMYEKTRELELNKCKEEFEN